MRDQDIAQSLRVGAATVERVRRRCVEEGLEGIIGNPRPLVPRLCLEIRTQHRPRSCTENETP